MRESLIGIDDIPPTTTVSPDLLDQPADDLAPLGGNRFGFLLADSADLDLAIKEPEA